jgi:ferredoxin/flavodoxin---NADP+ reductase
MPINYQPTSFSSVRLDAIRGPGGSGLPLNGTIGRRVDLNPELAVLTIYLNGWQLNPFEAGQFVDISLQTRSSIHQAVNLSSTQFVPGEMLSRSYSIASSPDQLDRVELLLNLVPRGEFTPALWRLNEGARVHVSPRVRGRFTLSSAFDDPDTGDGSKDLPPFHPHVVFVATGTGLAPYMSMLRYAAEHGPEWASATLFHSVRVEEDLAFRDELKSFAQRNALRFTYIPIVTRAPEKTWFGQHERVQQLLKDHQYTELTRGRSIRPEDTHIYLCGNPDMIDGLRDQFEEDGFTQHTNNAPGNLHFESYW